MTRLTAWMVCATFALSLCAKLHAADDKGKPASPAMDEVFTLIADDAGLEGADRAAFEAKVVARQQKIDAWMASEKGQKLAELRKQMSAARREKDDAKLASVQAEVKPLAAEITALRESTRTEIMQSLSSAQQEKVVQGALNRRILKAFDAADLTADQKRKIRTMTDEAGSEYFKEHPFSDGDPFRSMIGLQSSLSKAISEEILTDSQRDAMKAARSKAGAEPATKPAG